MPGLPRQVYAQEAKKILSIDAYDMLNTVPDTYLIDVRTRAEYQFVGHPFKAYLFPYMFWSTNLAKEDDRHAYQLGPKNKAFVEEISKVFKNTWIPASAGMTAIGIPAGVIPPVRQTHSLELIERHLMRDRNDKNWCFLTFYRVSTF